ncbi:MAG: ABC transporter substrate-binding protein, partial [Sulfitobacter sp.]
MTGAQAQTPAMSESSFWSMEVSTGNLPAVADRIPDEPLVVDLPAKGRTFGQQGGTLRTLISRSKDVRQMVVYGYARLVGYDADYNLKADILRDYEVKDGRKFTFHLRRGHRWSDGTPFTAQDFEYWWVDIANNSELSPTGPPNYMFVDGILADVTFPDPYTIVIEWPKPNPRLLQLLAQASPPFLYRPSHYLKQFHIKYADKEALDERID